VYCIEQVLDRSRARSDDLRRALHKARHTESVQDELMAWLDNAQERLTSYESTTLSNDYVTVNAFLKEHVVGY